MGLMSGRSKTRTLVYPGMKIHNWTIRARLPDDKKTKSVNLKRRVRVECACGKVETIPLYYLTRKNPKKSCGCMNQGLPTRHKLEYRVWYMMNVRCTDPNHRSYKDYGGRGITVCDRWKKTNPHGFANFLQDMGPRVSQSLTLDRIDVNGPYAPTYNGKLQCKWATWDEQAQNKRSNAELPPELAEPDSVAQIDAIADTYAPETSDDSDGDGDKDA